MYSILLNVIWPLSLSFCIFSPSLEWHCLCKSHDPNRVFYMEANWFSPRQQPDLCFCPWHISRYLEESAGSTPPPSCSLLSWARSVAHQGCCRRQSSLSPFCPSLCLHGAWLFPLMGEAYCPWLVTHPRPLSALTPSRP